MLNDDLKYVRKALSMTTTQIEDKIDITASYYSRIEGGLCKESRFFISSKNYKSIL